MQAPELTPRVVFEDESFLVLDKPAGMVVNRVETVKQQTIQDWVENYLRVPRAHDSSDTFLSRSGIVHRLDKETSGLLLVAKTPLAFIHLQEQFKKRQVKKRYLALVRGRVKPGRGEITSSITRNPFDRKKFGVFLGGRKAKTKYRVIRVISPDAPTPRRRSRIRIRQGRNQDNRKEELSLLEIAPVTGRTHQIRVHLKHIGYPVVGDAKYAGRKTARQDRKWCSRQFLHASFLALRHPKTNQLVKFESGLPKDLREALEMTRKDRCENEKPKKIKR